VIVRTYFFISGVLKQMLSDEKIECVRELCQAIDCSPALLARKELAFFKEWLDARRSSCSSEDESDEEEAPPELKEDEDDTIRKITDDIRAQPTARLYLTRGRLFFDNNRFDDALNDANSALGINPDLPKAYLLRAKTQWKLNNSTCAYRDMCEAQRLDYDEEYVDLHNQMRSVVIERPESPEEVVTPQPSTFNMPNNVNLEALMNNPTIMSMANNLMQNPEMINQMMSALQPKL
jgi:tetratricopeptide (TPR) repeat protein